MPMGAQNVAALLTYVCPALGMHHRTRVALTVMALTALDDDRESRNGRVTPARLYFGGWQPIASALGLKGSPDSQRQAVSRALRVALDLGVISVERRPRKGQNTTAYRLHLGSPLASRAQQSLAPDTQHPVAPDTQHAVAPHTQPEEPMRNHRGIREEPTSPLSLDHRTRASA